MGRGTLAVKDNFDAVLGKRRGVSPSHRWERIRDGMEMAVRDVGEERRVKAVSDALYDLSDIAHDRTPEGEKYLQTVLGELVGASGTGLFTAQWRAHKGSLSEDLNDAVCAALVTHLETDQRHMRRRRSAKLLANRLFIDPRLDTGIADLSRDEIEAYLPLIEAVARAYREGLRDTEAENDCKTIATCLGLCPSKSLSLFESWRDTLVDEVTIGNCDSVIKGMQLALYSSMEAIPITQVRKAFLTPLNEAIAQRRKGGE